MITVFLAFKLWFCHPLTILSPLLICHKKIQSLSYSHLAIETTETLMLELLFCLKLATLPVRIKIICCTFDTFCDNVSSWNICLIYTHTISWKHHFSQECCSQSQFTLRSKLNIEIWISRVECQNFYCNKITALLFIVWYLIFWQQDYNAEPRL